MLALILAAAIDPAVAEFLKACDDPKPTVICRAYLSGFVDALVAYQNAGLLSDSKLRRRFSVELVTCIPQRVDVDKLRVEALALVRAEKYPQIRLSILEAASRLYPCAPATK